MGVGVIYTGGRSARDERQGSGKTPRGARHRPPVSTFRLTLCIIVTLGGDGLCCWHCYRLVSLFDRRILKYVRKLIAALGKVTGMCGCGM